MLTRSRLFLTALLLWFSGMSWAQLPGPSQSEVRSLLLGGKFAELDQRFGSIQLAYRTGKLSDEDLRAAFRVFYDPDGSLEAAYSRWVAQSPKSYVAHLARGIYYKMVGNEKRGDRIARETTEEQFAGMYAAHRIASQEFEASLALAPKPLLSYLHYMDTHHRNREYTRRLLDKALALDPMSFIVREKYLATLRTRWGGSIAQMREFVEECRLDGLPQRQLARLHGNVLEDEADVQQFVEKKPEAAEESYRKAALLNPERSSVPSGPTARRAYLLAQRKEYAKAAELASEVLRENPDDIATLDLRADCYLMLNKGPEARADLQRAADKGDGWAQVMLGKMLLTGYLIAEDRAEAVRLFTRAADQQHPEAAELLHIARDTNAVVKFVVPEK